VFQRSAAGKDSPGAVWLDENTLPEVAFGALRYSLSGLDPGVAAASIVGGMRFLSIHKLTVAACRYRCRTVLFRACLVQLTAPTPYTTGRLLAVSPDMAKFLAVVILLETGLSFVRLYPDCNMAKVYQFEYFLGDFLLFFTYSDITRVNL
jgi:hypothetical protein